MLNIKFLDDENVHQWTVEQVATNIIEIKGEDIEPNISGFHVLTEDGAVSGEYEDYTTLYRMIDGGFQLSNDESVYVQPEPIEPAEPYEPTLEEMKSAKISEMEAVKSQIIENGIDVTLLDETKKHFPLDNKSLLYMMGLQAMVAEGQEQIPWHTDDENEPCEFYSNYDMKTIMSTAFSFIMYNETRIRDLTRYINSLTDKESVQAITYDVEIPEEFQSEVLQTMAMGM